MKEPLHIALPSFLAVAVAALAPGCYGAVPPKPTTIPIPAIMPGARIEAVTNTKTEIEDVEKQAVTCPAGHVEGSPACVTTKYTVREPVTHTLTTVSYGGESLSRAQLEVMTDRDRDRKLAELDRLSHRCERANTVRKVGLWLGVATAALYVTAVATQDRVFTYTGLGTLVGSASSYGYGYWGLGGKQCVEADDLYRSLEVAQHGETTMYGESEATLVHELASKFNSEHRATTARR